MAIWFCKIGEVDRDDLPQGSDSPMRDAVSARYVRVTGREPDFIFSGWGGELTEPERAVVEDRPPEPTPTDRLVEALEFYANGKNWKKGPLAPGGDGGNHARLALASLKRGNE